MTTPIVPSVTDELIAELEAAADTSIEGFSVWYEEDGFLITLADTCDQPFMAKASPATVKALLAHIAELKQQLAAASVDAERWRYARDLLHPDDIRDFQDARDSFGMKPTEYISRQCDVAIDAARNIGSGD